MMKSTKLIMRNIWRHPRRTILTSLTLALATFIFTVLVSVPASMDAILKKASAGTRVITFNANGKYYGLPARYCQTIDKIAGVVACDADVFLPSTYRDPRDTIVALAVNAAEQPRLYPEFAGPTFDRFATERRAAIAGKLLIRKYGWKVGDRIVLRSDGGRLDLTCVLVGEIPSESYPNWYIIRRDYLNEAEKAIGISEGQHMPAFLNTRVDRADQVPMVIKAIDENFRNSEYETTTVTESESNSNIMSAFGNVRGIVYSVSVVVLLTVLIVAANSMSMMVRDRLSEVALFRVLGFRPSTVAAILFGECGLIGITGGILGGTAALWISSGGMTLSFLIGNAGYLMVAPHTVFEALLVAVALSFLSGLLPVIAALRIAPAVAFRQVV